MFPRLGPVCLVLFCFFGRSIAVEVNRTIDDTTGDPVTGRRPIYLPQTVGVWEDATCKSCAIQPDGVRAFKGTWTAATYNPDLESMSVELAFKGTAIYIFFILANTVAPGITTETACNFTLDGALAGSFGHVPSPTTDFQYDALVFSQRNLPNVDHQFSISTSGLDRNIFVNFDYAIYTADDTPIPPPQQPLSPSSSALPSSTLSSSPSNPSTSSQPLTPSTPSTPSTPLSSPSNVNPSSLPNSERPDHSQIGAIAGGIVGGIIALLALLLLLLFCHRRRRHAKRDDDQFPTIVSISTGYQSNDSNAHFMGITPFVNPYTDRPDSGFIQNATIFSPTTHSEAPRSTVYGSSTTHNSTYSFSTTHQHEPMDPTIAQALPGGQIMMSADIGSAGSTRLLPLGQHSPQNHTTEAVRRSRQMEIDRQMRAVKQEMRDLKTDFHVEVTRRASVTTGGRSEETEMSDMREQVRMMKEQIECLQAQQQSAWAQGLSDEPPPGYSARHSGTILG